MQVAKVNGPPRSWINDYRVEITPAKAQVHEEKGGNKGNTSPIGQGMQPHIENESRNTLLLSRLA